MSTHDITLTVDGTESELTVEARTLLVHALRDELDHTAPKIGCEYGTCGACTVEVDGEAVKSCTVLAVQADGTDVTTVAGLTGGEDLHPIQREFHEAYGLQCGYCTPGMVMATRELRRRHEDPSRADVRRALKGNVCRCTGYHKIVDAVEAVITDQSADGEPASDGSSGGSDDPTRVEPRSDGAER